MNSEWMILSYSQNGTLSDLPRDNCLGPLKVCHDLSVTGGRRDGLETLFGPIGADVRQLEF